jgi:hypothetical protein
MKQHQVGSAYTKRYTEKFKRDAIALVDPSGKAVTAALNQASAPPGPSPGRTRAGGEHDGPYGRLRVLELRGVRFASKNVSCVRVLTQVVPP